MHPAEAALVDYAINRLAVVSGELVLTPTHRVGNGSLGEFAEQERTLSVACGNTYWSGVLAHELGHVEQLIEGRFIYVGEAQELFNKHIEGGTVNSRKLLRATRSLQRMELDAERYAVSLIDHFNLPIDRLMYIKSANAYVLSFEWARKHGAWPYSAWPLCSHKLITEKQLNKISPELESAFGSRNPAL
jgi:hypothetical protein